MSLADILRKHLYVAPIEAIEEKPFSLIKYLDTLSVTETIPPPKPDSVYRVSHVIKLCPREEFLRHQHKIEKRQRISAKLKRTFLFGENYHILVQNQVLGPSGYLIGDWVCTGCHKLYTHQAQPKKCDNGCGPIIDQDGSIIFTPSFHYRELTPTSKIHGISAHVDGVLVVNGRKKVLELKTVNAISFKNVTEFQCKPMDSHIAQINMYMWLMGIHEGIILYYDKNESNLSSWDVKFDPKISEKYLVNLSIARKGMTTGEIPKREACDSVTCTRARACPVAKICFQ